MAQIYITSNGESRMQVYENTRSRLAGVWASTRSNVGTIAWLCVFAAVLGFSSTARLRAQEKVRGAKSVLEMLSEAGPDEVEEQSSVWREKLTQFEQQRWQLPPELAATRWMDLYQNWSESRESESNLGMYGYGGLESLSLSDFVDTLPRPEAWPMLAKLASELEVPSSRSERIRYYALQLLVGKLADQELMATALKSLKNEHSSNGNETADEGEGQINIAALGNAILEMVMPNVGGDVDWQQQALGQQIDELQAVLDPKAALAYFEKSLEEDPVDTEYAYDNSMYVPNLLASGNEEDAKRLLRIALKREGVLNFEDDKTRVLAQEVASEMLDEIPTAQWGLCLSADSMEMFEAFSKLPSDEDGYYDYYRFEAVGWYVQGLISNGRSDEAKRFFEGLLLRDQDSQEQVWASLRMQLVSAEIDRKDHAKNFEFLLAALKENPDLPLWESGFGLALLLDRKSEFRELLDDSINSSRLSPAARLSVLKQRAQVLLSVDAVELAAKDLMELLVKLRDETSSNERMLLAVQLANVGRLTDERKWVELGVANAKSIVSVDFETEIEPLVQLLLELDRLGEAEDVVATRLKNYLSSTEEERYNFGADSPTSLLQSLVEIYSRAERHAEVRTLLQEAPWWGEKDLAGLINSSAPSYSSFYPEIGRLPTQEFGVAAAKALFQDGKKAEGIRICRHVLVASSGHDPAWALLFEHDQDFATFAQELFAMDPFEERPLIWLAKLYLDQEKLELAEKTIRQAIEIDPSDGEQGRGDRMRVYSVLADILEAKDKDANAEEIELFRGAVRAIRKAERADQFFVAGMLNKALDMYVDSLRQFADAYCIQSRLAVQYYKLGDMEAAKQRYQRAFELMPSSFGRVESHCFGCEGVFQGELAEQVAEAVFASLLAEKPDDPKVNYLMGYLEESKSSPKQAVVRFQKAVTVDPDYLNAWSKLVELAEHLDQEEVNEAVFALLRLDPLGRHSSPDIDMVSDFPRLWELLSRIEPVEEIEAPLFPLVQSSRVLEQMRQAGSGDQYGGEYYGSYYYETYYSDVATFAGHRTLQSIVNLHRFADQME